MLLPGLSLGSDWPAAATGRIGGVFRRACDVVLDGGGLLVLTGPDLPHLPGALRLATDRPLDHLFRPGAGFRLTGGLWRADRHGGSIHGLPVWRPPPIAEAAPPAERRVRLGVATAILDEHLRRHPDHRLPPDLECLCGDLARALASGDDAALATTAAALVGRGQGLTPSGDDLLVGCLAFLARRPAATDRRTRIAAAIAPRLAGTTAPSRHYLGEATAARFSEPLALLADALDAARPVSTPPAAVRAALAIGASSGADGIRGLLTAASSDFI
jgi:hypothetical protein